MIAQLERKPEWISYEDFLAAVGEGAHAEWVDGEVYEVTPPSEEHARISTYLSHLLSGYVRRKGLGGRVYHAPFQMKLARSGREPDVLYVSRGTVARLQQGWLEGPGDLAIEVLSPESRIRDRREKFIEYQQAGVREYWLVDPAARAVEVFRLGADGVYEAAPLGEPPPERGDPGAVDRSRMAMGG
jgi:Uma2 family endonuclease